VCLPCAVLEATTLTQPRGLFTATPPSQLATTLHTTELVQPTWRMNENGHYARTAVQLAELSTHARRQEVIAALTAPQLRQWGRGFDSGKFDGLIKPSRSV